MTRWLVALALLPAFAPPAPAADPAKPTAEQVEFFEKQVRPLLAENCYSCHGEKKQSAGLRLDTAAGLKQGADNGPVLVPGDPSKSRLVKAVRREGDYPMPPKAVLPPEAVAVLAEWVKLGAPFPDDLARPANTPDPKSHWAFKPVTDPQPPAVKAADRVANPIDAFVLAKLEAKGLTLAPKADRRALIRRANFDLIGLPPTAEEVAAFEMDTSPNAYEKVIDRLLASPHYGERWGRYWLDVARYADTKGYVFQEERTFPFAYTYRDYVVRSLNEDKPYDRFIVEQLAADKLPLGDDKRPLAAMGFLTLGRRFLNNTHDIIDDRIDVVTRGLMGLTVTCARCHDHKFDPVPAADYYSLYGVFASSVEPKELPLIGEVKRTPEVEAFEKELARREADYQAEVRKRAEAQLKKLRNADSVADYIRGVLDAGSRPPDQLQGFLRERDLNRYVFQRWQTYLTAELKKHSPVFSPLAALHAIPEKDFAAKAPGVIAALGKDPKKPVNLLVRKALTDAKPTTFREAAEAVAAVVAAHDPPPGGPLKPEDAELVAVLGTGGPLDIPIADFDKVQNRADRDALAGLKRKIDAFRASSPFAPPRAMVLADGPVFQPYVFLRGSQNNRGPVVPRQFLAVLSGPDRKPFTEGSGRLELAKAIASPENPLTARVMVNRVWVGHFGHGLVRTPSDFGLRSDPPSHPELLDWLAVQFVKGGWSLKKLHKLVMLSATYQQASTAPPEVSRLDPENRLLARQNRRRLDFEALRDSILFTAGTLDPAIGGKPVDLFKAPFSTRRTIYGVIDRTNFPGTMRAFDVANPDTHSPQRFQTTVPTQALFLMNSPFVAAQAKALAGRKEVASATTDEAKVTALYRLAFGRDPTADELSLGREFAASALPGADPAFGPWPQYAQVLLLSNEFAFVD